MNLTLKGYIGFIAA